MTLLQKLAATFLVMMGLAGCSRSPSGDLVVGMELAYPPFEMTDEQGRPAGVSVDLAQALGDFLGRRVKIENLPFDGLIPSLKTGRINLIISSMTATSERAQSIDFSEPYLQTGLCLLVGKDAQISRISDVAQEGKVVVVKQGTTGHLYATTHLRGAEVRVLDQENSCVMEVVQGKSDAFIYDQMSIFKHWQKNAGRTRAVLQPFQKEAWAVGLGKGEDVLRKQVNAFFRAFRNDGGFEKLGDRWLPEQKRNFAEAGIPFVF